ncbi:MAG: exodeoxyribonuclease V subunit gamma, partial [Candidatus Competibacteraceae bacterium]|nr:exodeoxyribonuclease V subunit gamma [Candidatus Competibacteraceae bacterium]
REYWGDIRAERDLARLGDETDPEAEYLTVGNPLLASFGKQGRDFIDLLLGYPRVESDHFVEPESDHLLHHLQADILHLRERGSDEHPPVALRLDDRSLQIHVCHGPMREVEVLHDQLLDLFATQRDLRPSDVMVMAPDIARYGPLIEAVFGAAPRERRIPFSIADQGLPVENPLVEIFFELLDLSGERFDAAQVLRLLEPPAVRRRFGLSEDDMERVRQWVRGAGIRWGIDASAKDAWKLPATTEHTWRAGLDRLLLGYALPGQDRDLYADILPYDEIEGSEALALGGLQSFLEALFALHDELKKRRPSTDWIILLRALLDQFFAPHEREENELQLIRAALDVLGDQTELAKFTEPVSLAVMKSALRELLTTSESGAGRFLSGGVTCCAMAPMRSIPFAVICLLGMNDDAYPRPQQPVGFDLLAKRFQRGDRSRRRDDRYLFLETLLSARRVLYLSYVGQSIRDNTVLPPSVVVSELLDVVDRSFQTVNGERASAQLITRHPLQAFSRRYFIGDARLFSYAREWIAASRQAGRGELDQPLLLAGALSEPEPALRCVTLETLTRFFRNPARWLLRERLGIQVDAGEEALETREPFVLDGLENYQLLDQMLDLHREGRTVADMETIMRASGALPHGQVGECLFAGASERVARFAGRLGRVLPRRDTEPREVDLTLGDFRVTGRLTGMTASGWVGYRLAKIKAADYLNLWLHHLALNVAAPEGVARQSHWVAEDQDIALDPLENAEALLKTLLDLYWQGSCRLLPFFPKSALTYIERLRKDQKQGKEPNPDKALWAARQAWEGSEQRAGLAERRDAYYQLAFGDVDPLDSEFTALATVVFEPLFTAIDAPTA